MSETIFEKVDYDLGSLVKYIELGLIRLSWPACSIASLLED